MFKNSDLRRHLGVCLLVFAACLWSVTVAQCHPVAAVELPSVTVKTVYDGDSLRLKFTNGFEFDARLHGVDAPEINQTTGASCKSELQTLTNGQTFRVWIIAEDAYNRKLVKLVDNNFYEVNEHILKHGCAYPLSPRRSEKSRYRRNHANANAMAGSVCFCGITIRDPLLYCQPAKFRRGTCAE